jgi:hypothetical protein
VRADGSTAVLKPPSKLTKSLSLINLQRCEMRVHNIPPCVVPGSGSLIKRNGKFLSFHLCGLYVANGTVKVELHQNNL